MIPLGGNLRRKPTMLSQALEGLGFCKTRKLSEGAGRLVANGAPTVKLGRVLSKGMGQKTRVDLGFESKSVYPFFRLTMRVYIYASVPRVAIPSTVAVITCPLSHLSLILVKPLQ